MFSAIQILFLLAFVSIIILSLVTFGILYLLSSLRKEITNTKLEILRLKQDSSIFSRITSTNFDPSNIQGSTTGRFEATNRGVNFSEGVKPQGDHER